MHPYIITSNFYLVGVRNWHIILYHHRPSMGLFAGPLLWYSLIFQVGFAGELFAPMWCWAYHILVSKLVHENVVHLSTKIVRSWLSFGDYLFFLFKNCRIGLFIVSFLLHSSLVPCNADDVKLVVVIKVVEHQGRARIGYFQFACILWFDLLACNPRLLLFSFGTFVFPCRFRAFLRLSPPISFSHFVG